MLLRDFKKLLEEESKHIEDGWFVFFVRRVGGGNIIHDRAPAIGEPLLDEETARALAREALDSGGFLVAEARCASDVLRV